MSAIRAAVCLVTLVFIVSAPTMLAADRPKDPPPSGLRELWMIPHQGMSPTEQVLAQTLQGLVGRKQLKIWLRSGSMYAVVEAQLEREGWSSARSTRSGSS